MSDGPFRIKDWEVFQHFKDRRPPWIKLYRDLLDDPEWHFLDAESAKILVMLWLLASEDKTGCGIIPKVSVLCFRLRTDEKTLKKTLNKLSHWLIQDDIGMISERYHDGPPETETETEIEGETEAEERPPKAKEEPIHEQVRSLWNAMAIPHGLHQCGAISDGRKRHIKERLSDPVWKSSFPEAIERLGQIRWIRGENAKKWKAGIDWFLRPDTLTKIMEGTYDDSRRDYSCASPDDSAGLF